MANWQEFNGLWINKPNLCAMKIMNSDPDASGNTMYIYYTFDGITWLRNESTSYATAAAAQSALDSFAATLG